ncbi:uncharacterized protein LOC130406485 [Gadus chalcogrammus]|uniref:uncharacterized protein LOC130406485 n=1 Tax=Gadus chalcogrammus TaxID=1042646 RepID=UPI0024C4AB07|nr:uncharacterized protein LOC130406485 [Gadus chalcogrammus]XP_056468062.1 uncharacterized protein LOC130406485 [Gadus chalcogrammus]
MATNHSCLPCTFVEISGDNLYFQVNDDETDLQSDSYQISTTSKVKHWLRVQDNLFLSVAGEQCHFVHLNGEEQVEPGCQFIVQPFNETQDSPPHPENRGRAVTLAVKQESKYKVVSCREGSNDIKLQIMDKLPDEIGDDNCWSLFYMKDCTGSRGHYLFVSAAKPNFALAIEPEQGTTRMSKLVLRQLVDEVDEGCHIEVPLCL